MSPSTPITGPSGASRLPSSSTTTSTSAAGAIAFQALLDKLRNDAQALEQDSDGPLDPKQLAGAVDRAHASLQDALSLSEQIIEALRAGDLRQRSTNGSGPSAKP